MLVYRESLQERLAYADLIIEDIVDSADQPLTVLSSPTLSCALTMYTIHTCNYVCMYMYSVHVYTVDV